jgi:hypothetical protein
MIERVNPLSKLFRNCLKTEIESLKRISRVFERNGAFFFRYRARVREPRCSRSGAGSAHGCAHCTMQRGNCMHAESPMRLRCVSPCGDAFDRRRSTSVDGARGELGSCLSRAHPPTLGIWWSRSRMGMALRVMSRCVSCPRPLPGSCSLIRTMGGQSSLCVSPPGRGGKYVCYLYRCVPPSATFTRD